MDYPSSSNSSAPKQFVLSPLRKWTVLVAVACGTFMSTLDSSIVNVALPSITEAFSTGITASRWVIIAYLFSISALLLFFGKLADVIGRKLVFNIGFFVFTLGCIACGLSQDILALILSRAVQGVGASMIMANGPAIITATFTAQERGKALGTLAMVVSLGLALGPSIGGFLLSHFHWPSIFFINIPFSIVGMILVFRFVPESLEVQMLGTSQEQELFHRTAQLPFLVRVQVTLAKLRYFDWLGALLWMFIQFGYGLSIDRNNLLGISGPLQKILSFGSAGLFVLFLLWERSVKEPILNLSLFQVPQFFYGNVAALFIFLGISSVALLMPFYFQDALSLSPPQVGLYMTAVPIAIFFVAPIAGRLSDRFGSRIFTVVGSLILSLALVALGEALKYSINKPDHALIYIITRMCFVGVGLGFFQSPNNNAIMGSVDRKSLGVASAMLATVRNFGLATGTAISSTLLLYYFHLSSLEANLNGSLENTTVSFIIGMHHTFIAIGLVTAVAVALSVVKHKPMSSSAVTSGDLS